MEKIIIIAEAGVNHNGSIELAKKLVDIAVEAKADAVKFQTFKAENVISKYAQKADYQKEMTGNNETQLQMVKKLELSYDQFLELNEYCKNKNIMFLSTPFDLESIDFLATLNMPIFKIPSGEITNLPYLEKIGSLRKKVILSTGMANLEEIEQAVKILKENGVPEIVLLHCNTEYPTPFEDVNLKAMLTLKEKFSCEVGYSDHTEGTDIVIAATAMGASIIEKHFTLDKTMEGPDHKASLSPDELKNMVKSIRNIEKALGDGVKKPSVSEMKNISVARKSIIAKVKIKEGEIFTQENLAIKRPGNGISPMKWNEIIGSVAKKDYLEDELI